MRAYETSEGMIEIFHSEPDEIITREEFDRRNKLSQVDAKIAALEEELAKLKALRAEAAPEAVQEAAESPVEEPNEAVPAEAAEEVKAAKAETFPEEDTQKAQATSPFVVPKRKI